jgi:hypothetical protein
MTPTPSALITRRDELGSAQIMVLLLLMMMSALAAALTIGGQTETFIARNQRSGAQAHAAAEAGLNHAVELATAYLFDWSPNGFASPGAAVDALLVGPDGLSGTVGTNADNGSLGARAGIDAAEDIPIGTRLTITAGIDASYEAIVMDDENAPDEDGNPLVDANGSLIVRATGYAQDHSEVTLEATLGSIQLGALVVDGDLNIAGSVHVSGTAGGVHANGDLDIGGSADLSGVATASGTYSGSAPGAGGVPTVEVPEVDPSDYRHLADFILTDDGRMTNLAGTVLCDALPCNNWSFSSGRWSFGSSKPPDGTYYVEGSVRITGKAGGAKDPVSVTVIAEGSINISGNFDIAADTPELLLVAGGDLEISGGLYLGDPLTATAQVLVHEQIKFSGNPSLAGQVIVENAPSVSTLVTANELSGNVNIIYNGGLTTGIYSVTGWREVR